MYLSNKKVNGNIIRPLSNYIWFRNVAPTPPHLTGYIFFLYSAVQWQRALEWFFIILLFLLVTLIYYFLFLSRWERLFIRLYQPVYKDLLKFEKHPRVCRLWWPVWWEMLIPTSMGDPEVERNLHSFRYTGSVYCYRIHNRVSVTCYWLWIKWRITY